MDRVDVVKYTGYLADPGIMEELLNFLFEPGNFQIPSLGSV